MRSPDLVTAIHSGDTRDRHPFSTLAGRLFQERGGGAPSAAIDSRRIDTAAIGNRIPRRVEESRKDTVTRA